MNGGLDLLVDPIPNLAGAARGDSIDMGDPANDRIGNVWGTGGPMPSFSRAFNMFTAPADDDDDSTAEADGRFFVPSYLKESTYMQMLEEAHKAKLQAQKDSKRSTGNGSANNGTAFNQPPLPPGAHRGMAHNVIERPPAFEDDDALAPLPTRWNKDDIWSGIELEPDNLAVKYVGGKSHHEREHEASAVRADHHMPPQCGIYYFEVQILQGKRDECVYPPFTSGHRACELVLAARMD